jgi:hypothetical protein
MTVYISGPITGKRNKNRRAFEKAQEKLERIFGNTEGKFRIISPVKIAEDVETNFSDLNKIGIQALAKWEDYMKACIKRLCDATHVYFLKDWEKSRGATLERQIAEGLGIPCADSIEALKAMEGTETWK